MADVGRPTVMTPEILSKLEYAFSLGCSDLEACFYANIGKTTLYEYQKENPDFTDRKAELKENPVLLARQSVIKHMADDGDLAIKYLERKKKDEFSLRQELTGKDGKDLPTPILTNVRSNNSNTQSNGDEEKNQGDTGRNVSE